MEDFLYILLLIAWVAFSIYNKNRKKKQKNAIGQPIPLDENQEAVTGKPRSFLEQILFGEEAVPIPYEDEEEEPDLQISNTNDDNVIKREYNQQISAIDSADAYDFDPSKEGDTEGVHFKDNDYSIEKKDTEIREEFDLRQAVIYSEILKRPYAN